MTKRTRLFTGALAAIGLAAATTTAFAADEKMDCYIHTVGAVMDQLAEAPEINPSEELTSGAGVNLGIDVYLAEWSTEVAGAIMTPEQQSFRDLKKATSEKIAYDLDERPSGEYLAISHGWRSTLVTNFGDTGAKRLVGG